MWLLVCLPIAAYGLLFAALCPGKGWRAGTLQAATVWGLAVAVITEGLSLINALNVPALTVAWLLAGAGAGLYLHRLSRGLGATAAWRGVYDSVRNGISHLDEVDAALLAGVGLIIALVGLTAVAAPPNAQDVIGYHLPRIVHWLHNHNVAFYASHDVRQLSMPP